MQARGPLMVEHRLIERMTAVVGRAVEGIESSGRADPLLVDAVVDFVRTYADRTRHGKEEDKVFFPAARAYFTDEEDRAMLEEFREFDRRMIHEKYRSVVEGLERRGVTPPPAP